MPKQNYNRRTWLNPESSHFTGSVVCHDGIVSNQGKPPERYAFLEIASCHGKIKLHADKNDGDKAILKFITKLCKLGDEVDRFINYLEEKEYSGNSVERTARFNDSQEKLLAALAEKDAAIDRLRNTVNALSAQLAELSITTASEE